MSELPQIVVAPPGPESRAFAQRLLVVESPAFEARRDARAATSGTEQAPIVYARGEGSNVFDVDGNRYVDLTAGFGALVLGYGPNPATRAAQEALATLPLALGDVYASAKKARACESLAALFPEPGARVMLGLSGADAVTCALKTAALATKKPGVVAFTGSYHGLSYGPLAACGLAESFREPFREQLGVPVTFAPYPASASDLEATFTAVRAALKTGSIGALLVEPLLGRGGCVVPPPSFLPALRSLADDAGALLVVDEIWTGLGRSGALLASSASGVVPDVVCLGKGLGGGLPISACIGRAHVMAAWGAHGGGAIHTGTHFGNPPACAAALATLAAIRDQGLAARAADVGARWLAALGAVPNVRVRGQGLMVGIELADGAQALALARSLLEHGYVVLTGGARGNVLTLSPALTIEEPLLEAFTRELASALV